MGKYPCRYSPRLYLFLIYINDLAENLSSNPKPFTDDTSLFSVVPDLNTCALEINDNLKKIEAWAHSSMENELQSWSFVAGTRNYILKEKKKNPSSWYYFQRQCSKKKFLPKHLGMFLDRQLVNLLALFVSSKICYRDHSFYKSINLMLDLT